MSQSSKTNNSGKGKDYVKEEVKSTNQKKNNKGRNNKGKNYRDSSKQTKGSKRNYSDKSKSYDDDPISGKRQPYDMVRSNDINWWNKSPIFDDVTRVPFNRIYGRPYTLRIPEELNTKQYVDLSGVMAINFVPSIGTAKDATSSVNRTFNSLFGELYSKTTGTPPIQYMDVANLITSLSSIACLIGHVKRALGISQLYNSWNYNFPKVLLKACGINPNTIIGKQDEVRYKLNDLILNFNNFKIPDIMDIYVRQYALSHNIYCDEDDVTTAMYVFKPAGYYIYDDTPAEGPSYLKWVNISGLTSVTNVTVILNSINQALEAWRNSSDLPLITGTLQRAFPDVATVSLDYAHESDVVLPTVDRNIMWQINNLNVVPVDTNTLDITQDPIGNFMKFTPELGVTSSDDITSIGIRSTDHLLNSYDGVIDKEFVMEATRLKAFVDPEDGSLMVPTEFVTSVVLWYSTFEGEDMKISEAATVFKTYNYVEEDTMSRMLNLHSFGLLSQFRIHPYVYYYMKGDKDQLNLITILGDVYKFTTVDNNALMGLHLAATQSAYRLMLR